MRTLRSPRAFAFVLCLVAAVLVCAPGAMAAEHGDAHGDGHGASISWYATDTWKLMNFLVLAAALFFLLRKPAGQFFSSRQKEIEQELADLEAKKAAAEKEVVQANERLRRLEDEAAKVVEDYVKAGEAARDRILAEAEHMAERLSDQARRHMEAEFAQAKARLREEILAQAVGQSEELIASRITDDDHNRLVGEYLEKVVSQ